MLLVIIALVAGSIICISTVVIPWLDTRRQKWQDEEERTIEKKLDDMFYYKNTPKQVLQLYYILPPAFGIAAWAFSKSPIIALVSAAVGLMFPSIILKIRDRKRRAKFQDQVLDAIMLLSSSLKGGLSLLQAFEVLAEEMPAPMAQEIGLVIRENKMGLTLEQSLRNLNKRMNNMEELSLVVNSILVARETGGDLTKVFSRLATTIRDNRKLKDSIKTLTLQGRLQGIIMSILPFVFIWWVITFNRQHFEIMFTTEIGKTLVVVAAVLQVIGVILIKKFSTIKI